MKRLVLALFALLLFCNILAAQKNIKDSSITCSLVGVNIGVNLPGGDLAKRFGPHSDIQLSYLFKHKKNYILGWNASYLFGKSIKENGVLDSISTSDGQIININGQFATVRMFERGISAAVTAGKMFPVWGPNPNCGIIATAGIGFLQHKIRIDDIGNASPQLTKEYKKGYDRLTNGISATEFIGYLFLSNKRMVNFYAGFEFTQAVTKSRRSYDYDLMKADTKQRLDLIYGLKIGWILPIYKRAPEEYYYH